MYLILMYLEVFGSYFESVVRVEILGSSDL